MNLKRMAAQAAVGRVEEGMIVGLGTGSTTRHAIEALGSMVAHGTEILGVPTSEETARLARSLGIPLTNLDEHPVLNLTIDGADEVDPRLDLIKGMGGALFREKLVALASEVMIVIVDESKLVDVLGRKTPVPVEVPPFGWTQTRNRLEGHGCVPRLRTTEGATFVTDNGNYVLDCKFPRLEDPHRVANLLKGTPGVVEHGLFLDMADVVLVSRPGGVEELKRP